MSDSSEVAVCRLEEIGDPGCREFKIGEGDWPFLGFVVRQGDKVFAYQNFCAHVGHQLNWIPDGFLTRDRKAIVCASHGAEYEIDTGLCYRGPCLGKSLRKVQLEVRDGIVYANGPTSM